MTSTSPYDAKEMSMSGKNEIQPQKTLELAWKDGGLFAGFIHAPAERAHSVGPMEWDGDQVVCHEPNHL